jgi:hypothetical protein
MQHDQSYTISLWMMPLGDYSWETMNKTMMKKYTHFAGHFDGNRIAAVRYRVHCPMEDDPLSRSSSSLSLKIQSTLSRQQLQFSQQLLE